MGFLIFAVKCLDVLAWPVLALGYPLCASIRAIETNSNSDMQKLITYWILFSLISLFELGFVQLIEWLPFWPYLKVIVTGWLVLPSFDGAYHVYDCLVRPLLSVNPHVVINQFNNPNEGLSLKTEDFLAMAERYIKEKGSEALEKFVASKSKDEKPNNDVELIKAVANTEKKVVTTIQMDSRDNPAVAKGLNCKEPIVARKHRKIVQLAEKNAAATAIRVKCAEPNLDKRTVADVEIKEMTAESSAHRENKLPEITTASVTNLPNPNHHCSRMYELFHVDFHEFHYETCVTSHPFVVANWAKMVMQHAVSFPETKTLVGLAISWTPRADPQKVPQPSLLQLCFGNTCIIFELWRECYYPQELKDLFDCNQIYFVGIDIEKTQGYLYANTKILISNIVDFRDWAATEGVIPRDAISRWNMTGMVARLLERHYEKPEDVIRSAWNQPLMNQQVFYASLNAFLSFQLGRKVCPWM